MATQNRRKGASGQSSKGRSSSSSSRSSSSRSHNKGGGGGGGSSGSRSSSSGSKSNAKRSGSGASHAGGRSGSSSNSARRSSSSSSSSSPSKRGIVKRAAGGIRDAGSKAVGTVKQHPIAAGVIGAGVATGIAVMAARAMRNSSGGSDERQQTRPEDSDFDAGEPGAYGEMEEGDDEQDAGEDDDEDDSSKSDDDSGGGGRGLLSSAKNRLSGATHSVRSGLSRAGSALRSGASAVGDKAGEIWEGHPLIAGASILAFGIGLGMMLPASQFERTLFGGKGGAGKWARRVKSAGRDLLSHGRQIAGKVMTETSEAVREVADREGLTPDKLARKVKRIAGRVKDVVADAIEE